MFPDATKLAPALRLSDGPPPPRDERTPAVAALVIGAFAVGQAIQVNDGAMHPAALAWLGVGIVALVVAMCPSIGARLLSRVRLTPLLVACIAIQCAQLLAWNLRGGNANASMLAALLLAAAGVALAVERPSRMWLALALLVIGHFAAGAMTIRSQPLPIIDVWHFQQGSTAALLAGEDPYGVRFRDVYGRDLGFYGPGVSVDGWLTYSYPYPPLTLLLSAPGRLFGDVRWSHLLALELSAVLLVAAARHPRAVLGGALLLLTPRSLLVIRAAWTEPMVILTLSFAIFCACRAPRWLWLAVGLMLSAKQYMIVAAPLMLFLMPQPLRWRDAARTASKAALLAACLALPFLLWNPESFLRSVALWQFRQPFRMDALSYAVVVAHLFDVKLGLWLCLLAASGATLLAWRRAPRDAFGFSAAFALMMVAFFAANKQAFCNYYFLVIAAASAAVALSGVAQVTASAARQPVELVAVHSPRRAA